MSESTESDKPETDGRLSPGGGLEFRLFVIAALVVVTAGIWLRAAHIEDPIRNDEAFTYLVYAMRGDYFNYSMPNNHVLNTLLVSASAQVAGGALWALRLPDFLFGIALIPAVGLLCFQLCGSRLSAVAAMALAASSAALVEYSTNARGYSLIACVATVMACVTIQLRQSPKWKAGWAIWVLCGVMGLYSVPTMIYAIAPLSVLLLIGPWSEVRKRIGPLGAALAATALVTALLYAPVIANSGLSAITANPYVAPETFAAMPFELTTRISEAGRIWGTHASWMFLPFLCAGTLLCTIGAAWRGSNRAMFLAVLAIAIGIGMAVIQRHVAPGRVFLYLQPWMIACACAGFAVFSKRLPRLANGLQLAVAVMLMVVSADSWMKVKGEPILISEDPHTYVEAKGVAAELIEWKAAYRNVSLVWDASENLWPPLLYYYMRLRPTEEPLVLWNDKRCNAVFLLVSRNDKIAEVVRRKPGFLQMYGEPRLIQETANSSIYLAERL